MKRKLSSTDVRKTLRPSDPGTSRHLRDWGVRLVCVRHRVDRAKGVRFTTVEIVASEERGRQAEARAAPRRARLCTRGGGRMGAGAQAQNRKGGDVRSVPERLADEVRDGGQAQTEEEAAAAQTGPAGRIRTTGLRKFEYPCPPAPGYPYPFAAKSFRIRIAMPISPLIHLPSNTS
jgi:hypothetical protein